MGNRIRGYLIGYKGSEIMEFEDTLENIYSILEVQYIDVAVRKIGNKCYDIVVDDEGLLKENPIPSIFDSDKKPMLFGNALILNHDDEGNFASLSDSDIEQIEEHTGTAMLRYPDGKSVITPCLVGAEY